MKIYYNLKDDFLYALDRQIPCSCLVRTIDEGTRKPTQIVKTTNKDGTPGVPYMPMKFPIGEWNIVNIAPKTDPYEAPYFISTDAWQMVNEWEVKDGRYVKPIGMVPDYAYGLHCSTSPTTLGCIRIIKLDDIMDLVSAIKDSWKKRESVNLTVTSHDAWRTI